MVSRETPEVCSKLLHEAIQAHLSVAARSSDGHGVDRHLLALKTKAMSLKDAELPQFMRDQLFLHSGDFTLSTSNTSFPFLDFVGYGGPAEGWGPDYIILPNEIHICITGWHGNHTPSCKVFGEALTECLREMKALVTLKARL
jgi:carnitine O-acetyltransferase